jgi:predicted PhzF superfamily epimerase YddE/YHI9
MARLHVLRVFCAEDGSGGNALGVFLDGAEVPEIERQAIAHELAFAETVFVDDRESGELRIFTPEIEMQLAGHPLVGTAWLLREEGVDVESLRPPAGETPVQFEGDLCFVAARPEWGPEFEFIEASSVEEIDALTGPPGDRVVEGADFGVAIWTWIDESKGEIRERVFFPGAGIPEDEATGSAALRLSADRIPDRPIQIRQGENAGSLIYARPSTRHLEMIEIGGVVALDEIRDHRIG